MGIGYRHAGVATGPSIGPRDPSVGAASAPDQPRAKGVELEVIRYDEKVLSFASAAFEQTAYWQPQEERGALLLIDRIVVAHDTFLDPVTTIFWSTNATDWNNSIYKFEFTNAPRIVAEYPRPIVLQASQRIIVNVGFGPGNTANIHFWYHVVRGA